MYKTITSVIDGQLKQHQAIHQYMQIDQRGCTTNSMGCRDNLIIDETTLEEAKDRKKNLSCTWIDVKKAFYSINHKWLPLTQQMHNIPTKITNFITNTMKKWSITLEVTINEKKERIGPIQLKQGILRLRLGLGLRSIVYTLSEPNRLVVTKHKRVHVLAKQSRKADALVLRG